MAESDDPVQDDARRKRDPASSSHLHAVWRQGRIVTDCNQHSDVHQRARRSSVEGQPEHGAAAGPPQLRLNRDQALLRVEGETHSTMAVSLGILPVYTMAKRLGRISTALR